MSLKATPEEKKRKDVKPLWNQREKTASLGLLCVEKGKGRKGSKRKKIKMKGLQRFLTRRLSAALGLCCPRPFLPAVAPAISLVLRRRPGRKEKGEIK
jgi:hypothetical protein